MTMDTRWKFHRKKQNFHLPFHKPNCSRSFREVGEEADGYKQNTVEELVNAYIWPPPAGYCILFCCTLFAYKFPSIILLFLFQQIVTLSTTNNLLNLK